MNFEEDIFYKMIKQYKTNLKENLIRLIRIITDCMLKKGKNIKIILCNEIEYIMFDFFAELLIKFIIYHKNESVRIESCQFRNGRCYLIKISPVNLFQSNRNLLIKEKEISIIQEIGLNGVELVETFDLLFDIPEQIADPVIKNLRKFEGFWLIDENFDFYLKFSEKFKITLRKVLTELL
jgi:hypothetical protein